jgi:hypothetical protein
MVIVPLECFALMSWEGRRGAPQGVPAEVSDADRPHQRRVAMALFVALETPGMTHAKIWVNAELITSIRSDQGCTMIHFDKDNFLAVSDSIDRVMLQLSTSPITT